MQKNRCGQDWQDLMTWQEYLKNIMEISKTCLLKKGHKGEHEWTDDDKWSIQFSNSRGII